MRQSGGFWQPGGVKGAQTTQPRPAALYPRLITIGDLFATVYKAFGVDWTKTYMTPIGRPIKIANSISDKTVIPIEELI